MLFRSAQAQLSPVLELLLADGTNPRSLAFQLHALTEHAANLPRDPKAPAMLSEQRRLAQLTRKLRKSNLPALTLRHEAGETDLLSAWLGEILEGLWSLSDDLTHYYFSHTVARVS